MAGDIIIPKKTLSSFALGFAAALGVLFLIGLAAAATVFNAGGGTIANVATPTANSDAATKAYVDAASGSFRGFTAATTGSKSGTEGMNTACNGNFSGSHACTYDEIVRLGTNYTYASDAWVIDGHYASSNTTDIIILCKDGACSYSGTLGTNDPNCNGWRSAEFADKGAYMSTNGYMMTEGCNSGNAIPCCD